MKKYFEWKKEIEDGKINEIAKNIRNGKIAIFPTETVYGIGTNVFKKEAVEKIYKIKNRPYDKAINVLVSNIEMIEQVAKNISKTEYGIIKNFFPGPLTIILNKQDDVPDIVTAGGNTIGVRMPKNDIALKLIETVGSPLATTSANYAGKKSTINMNMVREEFEVDVDYVIDGGESKIGIASTIVKVESEEIKILRQGSITKDDIERKIRNSENI